MSGVFLIYAILIVSVQFVLSASNAGCPLYTWQCNNGQCIKSEDLCDGNYDCVDKSDETVEECLFRPCPNYAFQCAYGACITGNFKCDGVVNCVDGSDETRYLCENNVNYEKEIQGKCQIPSSMQCKSGECISNERLCDGYEDCRDGSDETVEICSFLKCPEYSFRCGYGACVTGSSACDGTKDCRDGSDEIASICSNVTTPLSTTVQPPPAQPSFPPTTYRPTTSTTTIASSASPAHPPATSERPITYENQCSASFIMRGISSIASCTYQERPVSCEQDARPGTMANITCSSGYVEKHMKRGFTVAKCDPDGEWTRAKHKCVPECGTLSDYQKDTASKPWEVTILKREFTSNYEPICSGAIVSPKIVLSAANCFLNREKVYNTDHFYYSLIPGYFNRSFSGDSVEYYNISSISIKTMNRTQDLAVLVVVNYFQFSDFLKPICLPSSQSNPFPFYSDTQLNIGRPIVRDTSRIYLEYLIATLENKGDGRRGITYVNIYHYIPFINREIKKYDHIL